jgi:hypothetical protein
MVMEIFKVYKLTGDNLHRHNDRIFNYKLDINIQSVDESIIKKIEKIINKYKDVFSKNNMILSYHKGVYPNLEFFDDDGGIGVDFRSSGTYYTQFVIYIKNLLTSRVKPNKFIYHYSPSENRNSILEYGIIPKSSKESVRWSKETELEYPPLIFAVNDEHEKGGWYYVSKVDVWEIDTEKIDNIWWRDVNSKFFRTDLIMTDKAIPNSAIKLVNSLTLKPNR